MTVEEGRRRAPACNCFLDKADTLLCCHDTCHYLNHGGYVVFIVHNVEAHRTQQSGSRRDYINGLLLQLVSLR